MPLLGEQLRGRPRSPSAGSASGTARRRRTPRSAPRRRGRGRCRRAARSGRSGSATSRAWPPAPKVQSTAISPGCGSSSVDQLAGQNRHVRACHVKKDGQGPLRSRPPRPAGVLLLLPALARPDLERGRACRSATTSFSIPACSRSAVQRHAAGRSRAPCRTSCPARKRVSFWYFGLIGLSLGRNLSLKDSNPFGREDRDAGVVVRLHEHESV